MYMEGAGRRAQVLAGERGYSCARAARVLLASGGRVLDALDALDASSRRVNGSDCVEDKGLGAEFARGRTRKDAKVAAAWQPDWSQPVDERVIMSRLTLW